MTTPTRTAPTASIQARFLRRRNAPASTSRAPAATIAAAKAVPSATPSMARDAKWCRSTGAMMSRTVITAVPLTTQATSHGTRGRHWDVTLDGSCSGVFTVATAATPSV